LYAVSLNDYAETLIVLLNISSVGKTKK